MAYHYLAVTSPPAAAANKLALYANSTDRMLHTVDANGLDVSLGKVANVVTFSANGTYTTPAGVRALFIQAVGAGGGGAGAALGGASNCCAAGGGAAGSFGQKQIVTPNTTYAIVCGIAGAGGAASGNNGAAGTGTTVGGTIVITTGGAGGVILTTGLALGFANGGAQTAAGSGGDLNSGGDGGHAGIRYSGTVVSGGAGGSCLFGTGGQERTTISQAVAIVAGQAGLGFGSGGGGGTANITTGAIGGAGTGGYVVVYEFS